MNAQDYSDLLYAPIYATLGVTATLASGGLTEAIDLTAIDRTEGIDVSGGGTRPTIRPAAAVRVTELAQLGVEPSQLVGASVMLNGAAWRVSATKPKPNIYGEDGGELWLLLSRP